MKKSLFFFAAAALALTACTSENDILQIGQQEAAPEAVGFDVYVPSSTSQTRAGRTNVMTTTTLQKTGFGLFGYQTDNVGYSEGVVPNYMWNQQVFFNTTAAGWYYAPLKYWPNETKNDSQTIPTDPAAMPTQATAANDRYLDQLTFFAYAPWVHADQTSGGAARLSTSVEAPDGTGIVKLTNTAGVNSSYGANVYNPLIAYKMATDPNESVDLLWGVAPAGGLNYTNVSGKPTEVKEGLPLIDLTKPAVNTNLKFMFQHALARLGVKVVLAVDQVAAGGDFDYANTKVTIEKIEINGKFGTSGILDLYNTTANIANWRWKNVADGTTDNPVLTIEKGKGLAPHLIYDASRASSNKQQTVTGVTTDLADALKVSSTYDANYPDEYVTHELDPKYSPTTPYFLSQDKVVTPEYRAYKWDKPAGKTFYQKFVTNSGVSYTNINDGDNAINTLYPNATVWKNIYTLSNTPKMIANNTDKASYASYTAYRLVGSTYTTTGRAPEIGDYVFTTGSAEETPASYDAPQVAEYYYIAKPNYFMIVPNQTTKDPDATEANRTLKVKITYYVSTQDGSLKDGIVYTKNEVEKDIVLPHLKNGVAYNLKLILGLTSVKVEAEVADWVTTEGVVNLPQNTSE